jgi:hypothetical protein
MEHPVPEALKGEHELPAASCASCSEITGAFEGHVLDLMFAPLRAQYSIYGKRHKGRPKHRRKAIDFPLTFNLADGTKYRVRVNPSQYPLATVWPLFDTPGLVSGQPQDAPFPDMVNDKSRRLVLVPSDLEKRAAILFATYLRNAKSLSVRATVPLEPFCRLLAKIAYATAIGIESRDIARKGLATLAWSVGIPQFIRGLPGAPHAPYLVGCAHTADDSRVTSIASGHGMHEVVVYRHPYENGALVYARVQLFALFPTPVYEVILGRAFILQSS